MKIVQTPPRIFTPGGVERYVADLSSELIRRGHDVRIFCSSDGIRDAHDAGIPVYPLTPCCRIGNTPITPALPFRLRQQDFDILHTHLPTPWSADWSGIVARKKGRPLVLTLHCPISGEGFARPVAGIYNRTALPYLLRAADRIIITRQAYLPSILQPFLGKVACIPIGVDIAKFYPEEREIDADVFFLSVLDRYHDYKGLDTLMAAIRLVKKEIPGVRLVIGGGGPRLKKFARMAEVLGISGNVRFTGFIPAERLREYYNRSRVFVLPSRSPELEVFGIVLLEAMACGRPVVATEIAGMVKEIEASGSGTVVRPDDPRGLAEAILPILQDESLGEKMGDHGIRLMREKYRWELIAARIEQLYRDIL